MAKKELVTVNNTSNDLIVSEETIKNHFCKDASSEELALGAMICKQQGLNPFTGDVHFVKYGNQKMQIIISKYAFLKRAERNPNYDGFKAWTEVVNGVLVGKCEVYRKDRKCPFYGEAWFDEYTQKNKIWNEKPKTMIRKVAIVQTLREAFADELGGLYAEDEMPTFDHKKYPNYNEAQIIETEKAEQKSNTISAQVKEKSEQVSEQTEEVNFMPTENIVDLFKEKCLEAGLQKEDIKFFAKRNNIRAKDEESIMKFLRENDLKAKVQEFKDEEIPF